MARITLVPPRDSADKDELPVVADPDLCADDDMPDTVPDPKVFHYDGFEVRKGLIIE